MLYRCLVLYLAVLACLRAEDGPLIPYRALFQPAAPLPPSPIQRPLLFRVAPAFLVQMPWLDEEDPTFGGRVAPEPEEPTDGFNLLIGNDNPHFGFRSRSDPGGIGYNRVFTQVQLFDDSRTACSLVLQAFTPAGIEFDGLPDHQGATVLSPALTLYHTLSDDGTALQFSLNRHVGVSNPANQSLSRDWQCALALHSPLSTDPRDPLRLWHVSVEALGIYREREWRGRPPVILDVLPGLHWIPTEKWRISGAFAVPVDRSDAPLRSWQILATLQF
jgi:hypothetical protein